MPLAASLTSYRHRQQPQYAAQVDWSHPLARGLVFFEIPNSAGAPDLVGGGSPTILANTTMGTGIHGRSMASTSTASGGWVVPYQQGTFRTIVNEFTIATCVDIDAIAGSSKLVSVPLSNTTWNSPWSSISLSRIGTTAQAGISFGADDGSGLNSAFFSNAFQTGKGLRYVGTRSGSTARMLFNGNWMTPVGQTTFGTANVQFSTGSIVGLMNRGASPTSEGTSGSLYYAAIWNRALTEVESRSFQENPYQILKPVTNALYLFHNTDLSSTGDEFSFEFDDFSFETAPDSRDGPSSSTFPKFKAGGNLNFTSPTATSSSSNTLPKLKTSTVGARTIPNQNPTVNLTWPKFQTKVTAVRETVTRTSDSASTLPKLGTKAVGIRSQPGFSIVSASRLPGLGTSATGQRGAAPLTSTSSVQFPRWTTSASAIVTPPAGIIVPTTVGHRRAPSWRLVDAGTGQSGLSFASPLDPNSKTYFTVDFGQELSGSADTLWLDKAAIGAVRSPAAIVAGLVITAITFDTTSITVWLTVANDQANASYWTGSGETHSINFSIKTLNGQIFNRDVRVTIRQL